MFKCFSSYRGWLVLGLAIAIGGYLAIGHGAQVAAAPAFLVILALLVDAHVHARRARSSPWPKPEGNDAPSNSEQRRMIWRSPGLISWPSLGPFSALIVLLVLCEAAAVILPGWQLAHNWLTSSRG